VKDPRSTLADANGQTVAWIYARGNVGGVKACNRPSRIDGRASLAE
jgi:hypothetical protein